MQGLIYKALSGFYYVSCNEKSYECKARGNFRNAGISPLVGDLVEFESSDGKTGLILKVLPRKNVFSRPAVANIDKLFIVSSYSTPAPDTIMIDRLTVSAIFMGIEPIIVFNKCDMGDFKDIATVYKNANFKTYIVSAKDNLGFDELKKEIFGVTSAFAGNSGVGKSSIINSLIGEQCLKTGEVSQKLGRGKHTTRHTELFSVAGGFVADTPGFATFDCKNLFELKEKLIECFPDFSEYLSYCRFSGCTHTCEPGCSLLEALKTGKIEKSRFESYLKLFSEMKNLKKWEN